MNLRHNHTRRRTLLGIGAAGLMAATSPTLALQESDCTQTESACCDIAAAKAESQCTTTKVKKVTETATIQKVAAQPEVRVVKSQDAQTSFKYVSKSQDADGKSHSVSITRRVVDGKEEVDLTIDGKKYDVKSMEDVNRILKEKGLGHMRMDLGDDQQDIRFFGDEGKEGKILVMPFGEQEKLQRDEREGIVVQPMDKQPKAMLGVQLSPVDPAIRNYLGLPENEGVMVLEVLPNTPAEAAELKPHDIILVVVTDETRTPVDEAKLRKIIADHDPGDKLMLEVVRRGRTINKTVKLAEWNAEMFGAPQGNQRMMQLQPMDPGQFPGLGELGEFDHENLMKRLRELDGFRSFRLELDPETGKWRFLDEDEVEGKADGEGEQMWREFDELRQDQMLERMMQMMEQRMREFEKRMDQLFRQQREMRRDIDRKSKQESNVDA